MVDLQKLTQDLMDSQRFSTLVAALGVGWKKRALTDEDRIRLLEPILAVIVAKMDVQQAPAPRQLKEQAAARVAVTPKAQVSMGDLDSSAAIAELGFDPFVEQSAKEPNPVSVREQQLSAMKSVLSAANIGIGQQKMVMFPLDWNANDAQVYFSALGGEYVLGPKGVQVGVASDDMGGIDVSTGARLEAQGWKVDVIRMK
jgi:hypothetical protein